MNFNRPFIPEPDIEAVYEEMLLYYRKLENREQQEEHVEEVSLSNKSVSKRQKYANNARMPRSSKENKQQEQPPTRTVVIVDSNNSSLPNDRHNHALSSLVLKSPRDTLRHSNSATFSDTEDGEIELVMLNPVSRVRRGNSGSLSKSPRERTTPITSSNTTASTTISTTTESISILEAKPVASKRNSIKALYRRASFKLEEEVEEKSDEAIEKIRRVGSGSLSKFVDMFNK